MGNTKMTDKQKVTTMADSDYVFGNFGGKVGQMSIPDFLYNLNYSPDSPDSPDLSALRRKIDANTALISAAEDKNTEQDGKISSLEAKDATHDTKIEKLEERALQYIYPKIYQLNEGAGARKFDGFYKGSASVSDERKTASEEGYSYKVVFKSGSFYLQEISPEGVTVLYSSWAKIILPNNNSIASSESYALRDCLYYIYVEGEGSTYYYIDSNGVASEKSATYLLRLLANKNAAAIAALQGKNAEQDEKITAAQTKNDEQDTRISALLQDTPWEGQHMNAFTETGEYRIHGDRTDANDGLPILNSGTIDARLTVLGMGKDTDIVVTQILRLSNRNGGDGHVYVRTGQAANKSQLATPSSTAWGTWEKLMGIFEKNWVADLDDLNTYTTNGMYSGIFTSAKSKTLGGLQFNPGDTFLIVTVNGYAVAKFGLTPQLTQMLYKLPSKQESGNYSARMYMRTAYWNKEAEPKAWEFANWDRLAMESEISGGGGGSIEEYNRLNGLIYANTTEIAGVKKTATTAYNYALGAQKAATAEKDRNDAQDARLENIEARIDPDIAGRVWNEDNGTPKAESYYGSVKALRDLPKRLGLGRYLVEDVIDEDGNIVTDEKGNHKKLKKKLDPNDSRKYLDGTPAALDGTEGQCMWCWNGFYANIWHEGSRLIKAVTFDGPVGNDISIWIPAGGISWLGAGVMDRGEAPYTDKTKWKLCSVINNSEQFRGGGGTALFGEEDEPKYSKAPAASTPQISMLGMPATNISTTDFGKAARNRFDQNGNAIKGWEANWFVARFVVEFLFEIIMGTENSQEAFNANKDANGLYQGGFGAGVTGLVTNWDNYNGSYPVIPTRVGLEAGDGVCLVEYKLPQTNGVDGDAYYTFQVPVFFGLVGAGFGNLWQTVRGLIVDVGSDKSLVYVANSIYAEYYPNTVDDKIMVEECTREYGYISRKSYRGLCCIATEAGGSSNTRYADQFQSNIGNAARRIRFAGGSAYYSNHAGTSQSYVYYVDTTAGKDITAPLCYFTEDPIIQDSQSIATNS